MDMKMLFHNSNPYGGGEDVGIISCMVA